MRNPIPDPPEARRAAYLRETGRLDQLAAEGLEHYTVTTPAIDTTGGELILVNGELAYHSSRPGTKEQQLDDFWKRWKHRQLAAGKRKK